MNDDDFVRLAGVLDRMVREKEISAQFFSRVGEAFDDVEQRRWFRRMAQDEKDQRKILVKHRRELCGREPVGGPIGVSQVHAMLQQLATQGPLDYLTALRLACRSGDAAHAFCEQASRHVNDRSCRIFLKILSEEARKHRKTLILELRKVERETLAVA